MCGRDLKLNERKDKSKETKGNTADQLTYVNFTA